MLSPSAKLNPPLTDHRSRDTAAQSGDPQPYFPTPRDQQLASWLGLALALGSALLFLVLIARQMWRPFLYDDASFAFAARAVAETGLPFGNQGWMGDRHDYSQREQWALWHPPLYVYLLGLAAKLGGTTELALRFPGILSGLLSGLLTYVLARDLTRGTTEEKRFAGGVAAALAFTSPLMVQSALILDIDFVLLLPLTLVFLIAYFRLEHRPQAWLLLVPLVALMLWAKMTNPAPLVASAAVWQLLRGQVRRALLHGIGLGLGGAALFAVTWVAIGTLLGFPLDMPFTVNSAQWADSSAVARRAYVSLQAFIEGLQSTIIWLGPGFVSLGLAIAAVRAGQLATRWEIRKVDLLVGICLVLVLGYVNKSAGWFPKYQVVFAPLFAAAAAPLFILALNRPRRAVPLAIAASLAFGWCTWELVKDDWAIRRVWALSEVAGQWFLTILLAGLVLAWFARVRAPAVPLLVALALGWNVAANVAMARVAYSTTYWYGTTGTREAIDWANVNLKPEETYASAKEVALRAHNQRFLDQDTLLQFLIFQQFDGTWQGSPIATIVAWTREPYVNDLLLRTLPPLRYTETARFGDYAIWQRVP